jgi:hypothetical protein
MKHGTTMNLGGGAKVLAFTITTDGSGDPTATVYGPSIGGAVTVARTGTGIYAFTWDVPTYGANGLAYWNVNVNLGSGDWTTRGSVNRSTGVLTVTMVSGGSATNVVSGELTVMLCMCPIGY